MKPRVDHHTEYGALLARLVKAMRLPAEERERWVPLIHAVAIKCNEHRASLTGMTEEAADVHLGTVLDLARGLAATPPGPTVAEFLAIGAVILGEVSHDGVAA